MKRILEFLFKKEIITNDIFTSKNKENDIFDVESELVIKRFGGTTLKKSIKNEKYNLHNNNENKVGFKK